jgi:hypothetical protein
VAEFKGAVSKAAPAKPVLTPPGAALGQRTATPAVGVEPLAPWFAALTEALTRLESARDMASVEAATDAVRLALEAAAHAGVAPAARAPLQRVLEALVHGDVDAAITALKALLPRRSDGFWT